MKCIIDKKLFIQTEKNKIGNTVYKFSGDKFYETGDLVMTATGNVYKVIKNVRTPIIDTEHFARYNNIDIKEVKIPIRFHYHHKTEYCESDNLGGTSSSKCSSTNYYKLPTIKYKISPRTLIVHLYELINNRYTLINTFNLFFDKSKQKLRTRTLEVETNWIIENNEIKMESYKTIANEGRGSTEFKIVTFEI